MSLVTRIFFVAAFILLGSAFSEKIALLFGLPGLTHYSPSRLISFAVTALLFVIALELRGIKHLLNTQHAKDGKKEKPVAKPRAVQRTRSDCQMADGTD
jgi:hypothetical protein